MVMGYIMIVMMRSNEEADVAVTDARRLLETELIGRCQSVSERDRTRSYGEMESVYVCDWRN